MTRALQNRLALANVKVQNGWGNLPLESLEPRIEQELKRKRPSSSSNDALSDTSSTVSAPIYRPNNINSSPLTGPLFSDELAGSLSGSSRSSKRSKSKYKAPHPLTNGTNQSRSKRTASNTQANSWKRNHQLPESSPVRRFVPQPNLPIVSFMTETTIADDAADLSQSEDDDSDLPLASFQSMPRQIQSSPPHIPRTPSPDVARSARLRSKPFANATSRNSEDAADLLMFLAASPSPAVPSRNHKPRTPVPPASSRAVNPPSTPPQQKTPLPSSMLSTPGGSAAHFLGMGAATPGVGFNFSDFLNVTPSPAQAAWRTPGLGGAVTRTPLVGRDRKSLNFDALMPPGPNGEKVTGLGMELGGELVSSQ
jgi:hypothetical protein